MISLPAGSRIWLVAGITDMRNGFNGLASKVQNVLKDDPFSGHLRCTGNSGHYHLFFLSSHLMIFFLKAAGEIFPRRE